MHAPVRYTSLTSLFTGAKEAKFPYISKRKPVSSWFISKSSIIFLYKSSFCTSNSLLMRLFCCLATAFVFVTNHCLPRVLRLRPTSSWKWEKSVYNVLNMDIFLTKTHRFAAGGLYSPPRSHVRHVLLWMDALYLTTFGLLKKKKHLPMSF